MLAEEVALARSFCSHSNTERPVPAVARAIPAPLMPPPTTNTSTLSLCCSGNPRSFHCLDIVLTSLATNSGIAINFNISAADGRVFWKCCTINVNSCLRTRKETPYVRFWLLAAVNQFQNHGSFSPESGHSTDHPFNQRFYGQTLDDY